MKKNLLNRRIALPINLLVALISICLITTSSCQKAFLDQKPDNALVVTGTLQDFQSLLDNSTNLINLTPSLNENCTDDFYTTDAGLLSIANNGAYERDAYLFAPQFNFISTSQDWDIPYQQILYANVVLEGLEKIVPDATTIKSYNSIKGSALFIRAFALYGLTQQYTKPYTNTGANTDLGVPIRLTADVNAKSNRPSLQADYDQIISDLSDAQALLPILAPLKSRPTNSSALAMLARVYLSIGVYDKAGDFADRALKQSSKLINYNILTATASKPFPIALPNGNDEVIYYTTTISSFYGISSLRSVDSTLYRSYDNNDLRKVMFWNNRGNNIYTFKGTYSGGLPLFGGLATDELFLIRAESYARAGNLDNALKDLNTLLINRFKTGTFKPLTAATSDAALTLILTERRKELVGRCLRWTDLRRLNLDSRYAVTVKHINNSQIYTLLPNSNLYTFPIPQDEILNSGIQQNLR